MAQQENSHDDDRVEQQMGRLLQVGVLAAAFVVLVGAIIYFWNHGQERVNLYEFHAEPETLRNPLLILEGAAGLRGREVIQFGLMLLVATPVARVVFSVYIFVRKRDSIYVCFTLFVLIVLIASLVFGHLLRG
jgi:uncharacterized membrane protein